LLPRGILANDFDFEGDPLTVINLPITTTPTGGSLAVNADGSFTYTPAFGFAGTVSFNYQVNDGSVDSAVAQVRLTVTSGNLPPVANPDAYSTKPGVDLNVSTTQGVLKNDTDPQGHDLTAAVVTPPANASLFVLGSKGSIQYRPNPGFSGTDFFTYRVNDGQADSALARVEITVGTPNPNQPPVASIDSYTGQQDRLLTAFLPADGLLDNDTDPDGDTLTAIRLMDPMNGTILSFNTDGTFAYEPNAGYSGTDSFTYAASDGQAQSAATTVNITVNAANQPPVANNDKYSIPAGSTFSVTAAKGLLRNDIDPEGQALLALVTAQPTNGSLAPSLDGSFTYTPNAGFTGIDSFMYEATDKAGAASNAATVQITVNAVNNAPVANDDRYVGQGDTVLASSTSVGLLDNDSDADGDTLTAIKLSDPTNGRVIAFDPDGSFVYLPNPGYVGQDSFTYAASDGTDQSPAARVDITVNAANQPPTGLDDSYSVPQDTVLSISASNGVLANDSDPEGGSLVALFTTQPTNGGLAPSTDGSFTYTPDPGFSGADSFEYLARDGGGATSNPITVQITVNAINLPPVANNDVLSIPQDTVVTVADPGVLGNDTDPEGHALRISTIESQPTNGSLSPGLLGGFTYTPNPGFSGTDTFSYRASDNAQDSNIATVQITVNAVNLPPVANGDVYVTPQGTALTVAGPGLLANDADPEGQALRISTIETQPANGSLSPSLLGGFTYTPNPGFSGTNTFSYRASDNALDSNIASVQITVTAAAANLPPVANGDVYAIPQDTVLTVAGPGLLANDADPEGQALRISTIETQPANGSLSPSLLGGFTYTPNAGFSGTDSFSYRASDNQLDSNIATVGITVTAVASNLPPVANGDLYAIPQGTVLNVASPGVLANDADPEGHALSVTVVSQPTNGTLAKNPNGGFSYTPNAGFSGTDSYTYTANDGALDSNVVTVQITVTATASNLPPVANADVYTTPQDTLLAVAAPGVLSNDSDPEGHALTVTVTSQPANGALAKNPNGSFSYVPNAGFIGTDTYTYTVSDGLLTSNQTSVSITVTRSAAGQAVPVPALGWPALLLLMFMTVVVGLRAASGRVRI
jgi:hypothetical protein